MMHKSSQRIESVIGLDVAMETVTLHDRVTGRTDTVANTLEALIEALEPLKDRELAVCEATGGHEDALLAALAALAIPAHRGDGAKIHAFARSFRRAKTDRIDAMVLAEYGAERGKTLPRYIPEQENHRQLTALVRRRIDLVEARKRDRTRASAPRAGLVRASLDRAVAFLDAEIDRIDRQIKALVDAAKDLAARKAVLETIPGIAHTSAVTILALMPELGRICRRRAASLAALAPHPRDSGKTKLKRPTTGGRRELRPTLFLAALTAARGQNKIADFYKRLVAQGKPKRLALVAAMRKIIVIANAKLAQIN